MWFILDYYCTAGQYFNYQDKMCKNCSVGFYQPTGVLVSCQACPQNYSTQGEGNYGSESQVCWCELILIYTFLHGSL